MLQIATVSPSPCNHCVAIVPKLHSLVLLQHQETPKHSDSVVCSILVISFKRTCGMPEYLQARTQFSLHSSPHCIACWGGSICCWSLVGPWSWGEQGSQRTVSSLPRHYQWTWFSKCSLVYIVACSTAKTTWLKRPQLTVTAVPGYIEQGIIEKSKTQLSSINPLTIHQASKS